MFEISKKLHTIALYLFFSTMQKITLIKIIREEILRAVVFASTLFVLVVAGSVGIAYAADG